MLEFYPCEGQHTTAWVQRGNPPELFSLNVPLDIVDIEHFVDPAHQMRIIKRALQQDPGCIFSLRELARQAGTPALKVSYLARACMAGQELWDPVFEEMGKELTFWEVPSIRATPTMRMSLVGWLDSAR